MLRHLRGPLPCSAFLLLLLAGALGWRSDGAQPVSAPGPSFPVAQLLVRVAGDGTIGGFGPAALALALLITAAGATLGYQLLLAWTGNRIVSLLGAALTVTHPLASPALLGSDSLAHAPAFFFALATLGAREKGWQAWRLGRAPFRFEVLALLSFVAAVLSGPAAFAVPLLILLADLTFHAREPGGARREVFAIAVLYTVVALALWHFDRPSARPWHGPAVDFGSRTARLLLLPLEGVIAWAVATMVVAAGVTAYAVGLRSLWSHPRFVLLHFGFGLAWYLLADVPAVVGCMPETAHASLLPLFGPGLILPSLAWRFVLALVPKPGSAPGPPPVFDAAATAGRLPEAPAPPPARRGGTPVRSGPAEDSAAIRSSVEVAVGAAVEAAVAAAGRALRGASPVFKSATTAPGSRYAAEWDRYEAEWSAKSAAEGRRVLGEEWSDRDLEQNLFENYCRPHLAPHFRVLEIGQGGGKFTAMIAPEVAQVVCVDVSAGMLKRARKDLAALPNVAYVLADGRGLAAFSSGVLDFAFAYDVFVHLDQEDIFIYLQDLRRVLRPGARAVFSFANLLDPLGFRQFQREAAWHRTGRRSPGRINFLSPEIVRTLAAASGLEVVSVHLSANNRDLLAVLERGMR